MQRTALRAPVAGDVRPMKWALARTTRSVVD